MARRARPRCAALAILLHGWLCGCNSTYIAKGNGGAGGGADAGPPDADGGACVAVKVEELPDGGGPACSTGGGCHPGDVTTFSPQPLRPVITNAPHAGRCTTTQISDWYASCVKGTGDCQGWLDSSLNTSCRTCILTPHTAAQYGALITYTSGSEGVFHVNLWGCLALVEPCNAPCAQALQADSECADTACNPESGPCLIHDQASFAAYQICSGQEAPTCGCSGFHDSAVSCKAAMLNAPKDHPAVDICGLGESSLEDLYTKVASYLCGQ